MSHERTRRQALYRSLLFVPGNRPERFAKALDSGADAVIVDLEDAVAPDEKYEARAALAEWLTPERAVLIRVNARDTRWFDDDAKLGKLPGVAGIVLPKAESAHDVIELVSRTKSRMSVFPLIESAQGMMNAQEIASAPFVHQLLFGTLDFCADMNLAHDEDALNHFRVHLTMISRVAGIHAPIDGVTPAIDDEQALHAHTVNARRLGFAGELCIHPKQVKTVNDGFLPTESEIAWAMLVMESSENAKGAVVTVDGKMVDRPVVMRARSILDSVR
ncbi:HpcH/HpaI aldolase/citrate lyase family protein [Paraburkholderia sp. ZP32-5]|uniref:HpcH/HpaI aldolase/citrate lyase family protein n=1 Tax=Paraburkholderia sp. ZP32-5 TaxID=2883245 RepID=UPI001F187A93|nr:CoA ester lyase [Paraburkholderia sp. ZP32-5]